MNVGNFFYNWFKKCFYQSLLVTNFYLYMNQLKFPFPKFNEKNLIYYLIYYSQLYCMSKKWKNANCFNIDKDFKIMSVTQDNKIYHISMKSEDNIEKFLKNFKKNIPMRILH